MYRFEHCWVEELSEIILKYSIFSNGTILFRVEEQIKQNMGTQLGKFIRFVSYFLALVAICFMHQKSLSNFNKGQYEEQLCKLFQNRWHLKICSIFSIGALYVSEEQIMVVSKSHWFYEVTTRPTK